MAQKLTTICDFCLAEDKQVPNLGKYQAEMVIEDTRLVADVCDDHIAGLAVGFHPRRGRAPAWLTELRGEEPAPRKRRQRSEKAETPEETPEVEPDEEAAPDDEEEGEPDDDQALDSDLEAVAG